ncbi:DUF2809 domain-containing protein [Leifsonia sp. NPDC058248]|uniref:ribosomal maturation YjgA family protein n=1 Tax=Leifsonia sp. NPDC058248 TaxID=3346402 RepID=UPI0036DBC10E
MVWSAHRRAALIIAAVAACVVGLTVHEFAGNAAGAFTGDALYSVLIYALLGTLVPRTPAVVIGGLALAACVAVELFQLTGLPSQISAAVPGAELVLGSTFQVIDLLAYAFGAAGAAFVDTAIITPRDRRPEDSLTGHHQ